jgi:ABC-type uncharacterized transport system involved in gliding motility auxiliary subunit
MKNKIDKNKYYKFIVYMVALILVNLVSLNRFYRIDLTGNGLYSLSEASIQVVSTLREPLTVNVFFSKNIPAPYNNIEKYLHDLLEEYSIHSNEQFSFRFYNVTADEGDLSTKAKKNRELAESYGVYPVNIQTIENDQAKVQRAYMGMVLIHGDVIENINSITSTEGLEYTITTNIDKMNNKISALLNLKEDIKVTLLSSSTLNTLKGVVDVKGIENLNNMVKRVVDELNKKSYNRIKLQVFDPAEDQVPNGMQSRFERFKLQWDTITTRDKRVIPKGSGMIALGIEYNGKTFEKNLLSKSVGLTDRGLVEQFSIIEEKRVKEFIEGNIDDLIQINDNIGYVSSNGTLPLMPKLPPQMAMMQQGNSELKLFNDLVSESYSINQIDLKKDEIPDSIDTLIIAGAQEKFSDWELFQIDQFLMKGKSLAIFMDPFKEIKQNNRGMMNRGFQQPVYLPINTNLEKLLDFYGVKVEKAYLMDKQCYINRDQRSGEMPIYYAPMIKNENINHSLRFLKNIKQMVMIKSAPITLDKDKLSRNKIDSFELLSSSSEAWEMKGRINLMPMFIRPPQTEDQFSQYSLAYLLEGEMGSYFADRKVPSKPIDEKSDNDKQDQGEKKELKPAPKVVKSDLKSSQPLIKKGKRGRIFVMGSTEFIKNNVLISKDFANAVFLTNTLDYLNNKESIAVLRGKKQTFNPVKDSKLFIRRFAQYFNIAGLPLLIIILGLVVWIRRTNRKRAIKKEFTRQD